MYKTYTGVGIITLLFLNRHRIYNKIKKSLIVYLESIIEEVVTDLNNNPIIKQQLEDLLAEVINNVMVRTDVNKSMALQSYDILSLMMSKPASRVPLIGAYLSSFVNNSVCLLKKTVDE